MTSPLASERRESNSRGSKKQAHMIRETNEIENKTSVFYVSESKFRMMTSVGQQGLRVSFVIKTLLNYAALAFQL